MRRAATAAALAVVVAAAVAAASVMPAAAARRGPVVQHMVVYPSGKAKVRRVRARGLMVRVGRRRCAAGTGTPLAALVRSRPGRIRIRDYGSCGRRPADSGGLFVRAIGRARNHDQDGWVYKVGKKAATAGAADTSGPFGRGRLRSRQRITWFYCRLRGESCQRTLWIRVRPDSSGVTVRVLAYDDEGRGVRVAGATVSGGGASALSGPDGMARLGLPPGRYTLRAVKRGLVRSFPERSRVG